MRVISDKALREFWKKHPSAEQPLRIWHSYVNHVSWHSPDDIKRDFASASFLAQNRVIFNIHGNDYRLVVVVAYKVGIMYARFIGTHQE